MAMGNQYNTDRLAAAPDKEINAIMKQAGIQQIYNAPTKYTPTYVLGVHKGRPVTVSEMLKHIGYLIRYIKAHYNVNQEEYKETISFLSLCELRLQNQSVKKPKNRAMHFAVKVFHEIQDHCAANEAIRRENENIALALDVVIDLLIKE